jgi:asparagine N-glycosylation enzyme membrane subunit Stt3
MSQFAFNPTQTGGIPRPYASGYMPTSISAAGLPIVPPEPMPQWLDMLHFTSTSLQATDVVIAWWDYGYWLSVMGNVTTLADNATVDAEQIENLAYIYMSTEEDALNMISTVYGQKNMQYILIFPSMLVFPSEDFSEYYVYPYGLGDEGKWTWMARISGGAKERLTNAGFMHPDNTWTNEKDFGQSGEYGWEWNSQGINTVIYKLLSNIEYTFASKTNGLVNATSLEMELQYFKLVHVSGAETSFSPSGDLIPLVGLYKIDWAAYNAAHPKR